VLAELRKHGVELSLDDFGTGYSSLAHLKSIPVTEVKIDRSFVVQMCTNAMDAAIVCATIQLARNLGMSVVAEGVEDEETWAALEAAGCHFIQGYVISRPVQAAELEQQLHGGPPQRESTLTPIVA
jgi:EAL domain-containing protein (putative c-di-GMP-specific phosphodiesterase class I)